jgi:Extracellular link domain
MNSVKVFNNSFIPNNNGMKPNINFGSPANAALNSLKNTAASMGKSIGNVANNVRNTMTNTFQNTGGNLTDVVNGSSAIPWVLIGVGVLFVIIIVLMVVFYQDIKKGLPASIQEIFGMSQPTPPAPMPMPAAEKTDASAPPSPIAGQTPASIVEKVLPGRKEVFNIASNRYMYEDAAPLCKALGAELATYDQVKSAFDKGADWCNYGWTKGQLALFPTQEETWSKLQSGPEGQRNACGRPGINGGYFDNPELRFGVNCYGTKPGQSAHDAAAMGKGAPLSPDALDFDKRVNTFRSDADHIAVNPFREGAWSE